ncbi:DUF262 domain-containing protein [Thiocystis violascens]|uniref:GmrSD restriction endonucleases N-terminal domain-containing protein n=1 Tax=Thiocystis violascens (strain ATCC 17096 / DSM 198 / 6111) TaxID=765911 RepID=I3YEA9_THIV6|nr:DUF262 domain-containing protein [Thiocystis violascens]AFL75327.1 hypothetical protein Thivi_3458 [Thiocystis violascens DSM 198]
MEPRSFSPEVKPEVVFVFELVRNVTAGKLRIPNFQRGYVWRRVQMLDLLDSIRRRYPIGSLLIWDTDEHLSSRPNIGPIPVPRGADGISSHVLDGHQRLSTLAGALMAPLNQSAQQDDEDPGRWEIWYNAKDEQFEHPRVGDELQPWHFPLRKLMDTISFIGECKRILHDGGDNGGHYVRKIEALLQTFNEYKLPIIRISNTELTQAVDIFARLNSKGQPMSADQMVSALMYREAPGGSPAFNLSEMIDEMLDLLDGYGFGGIDRTIVLRGLLACLEEDIYRTDWTRLVDAKRSDLLKRLPSIIEPTKAAMERAARFLNSIGVYTDRLLPYAMQLVVLAAFFRDCESPTPDQTAFLRRWFWVSSFAGWFASGNPSRVGHLVAEMRGKIARTSCPNPLLENMRMDEPAQPFPKTFDMRSARARTWLLVLLSLQPRGRDGKPVEEPWRLITEHRSNAIGYIAATVNDKDLKSSPANRILRFDPKDRSQAMSWLLKLDSSLRAQILLSHGIPPDSWGLLETGNRDAFLNVRRDYLIQLELEHMKREGVIPPPDPTPQSAAIDTE